MQIIANRAQANGSLSEQFSRADGTPLSAYDLTWSYAAFLTAAARRAGVVPYSWGEPSASSVPSSCSTTTAANGYSTASSTSFPANQTPVSGGGSTSASVSATTTGTGSTSSTSSAASSTTSSCVTATSVAVTFNEIVTTTFGQTIKIVGSVAELGNWNTGSAVALSADQYTSSNHLWHVTVNFAPGTVIQYKFINVASSGTVSWEADPNRAYTVPATCATTATVGTTWR